MQEEEIEESMKRIVFYENYFQTDSLRKLPLEFIDEPVRTLYLRTLSGENNEDNIPILLPKGSIDIRNDIPVSIVPYASEKLFTTLSNHEQRTNFPFMVLSSARYLKKYDESFLHQNIFAFPWDILTVQIVPQLEAGKETIRRIPNRQIVGFRRLYMPEIEPHEPPSDWPDLLYIKPAALERLKENPSSSDFPSFLNHIGALDLQIMHIRFGGQSWDLCTEDGFFEFLDQSKNLPAKWSHDTVTLGNNVRIIGNVHIGSNVRIQDRAVIIAPAILGNSCTVGEESLLRGVWLSEHSELPAGTQCQNHLIAQNGNPNPFGRQDSSAAVIEKKIRKRDHRPFRCWPPYSYPNFGKRLFDLFISSIVLILFIPFFLIIGLLVKITSPGPIFYRARRQGVHGKEFDCLKFRTMMVQADAIQDKLRMANQVDGPQFKIEDDPRITKIGKFLRDTCIDEIPQFFNVLKGEMSVVGPRPSPESENQTCPYWRDARLSVRPGITGLWQVMRTRQESMDFQEWIYYDTNYVRKISFRLDFWICYKTAQKLIHSFLDQFG